jgi:hypothetical protein
VARVLASGKRKARVYPGAVDCGTAGYITLGSHAAYNRNNIVISASWKPPAAGYTFNNARIISIATSVNDRLELIVPGTSTSNALSIAHLVAGAGPGSAPTTGRLRNAKWQHLIVSSGASGLYIFNDGSVIYSDPTNQAMAWPSNPTFVLGTAAYSLGAAPSIGAFADITIHSSEITTAGQALALYLDDVNPSTPVARWAFDDLTGTTVSLTSGSGNAGTIVSGSWTDKVPMVPRDAYQNLHANSGDPSLMTGSTVGLVCTGNTIASPVQGTLLYEVKEVVSGSNVRRINMPFPTGLLPNLADSSIWLATAMVIKAGTRKYAGVATAATQIGQLFDTTVAPFTSAGTGLASTSTVEDLGGGAYLCICTSTSPSSGFGPAFFFNDDTPSGAYAVTSGNEKTSWFGNTASAFSRQSAADATRRARAAALSGRVTGAKPILFGESF